MDEYVTIGTRKFKKGYTTGSCAAAAVKAAIIMLVTRSTIYEVTIKTPQGLSLKLPVNEALKEDGFLTCSVTKDGGDDPDVTKGLKIYARVELTDDGFLDVKSGEGIGIVTLKGLKVNVGKPAINPVPMKMIIDNARDVLPTGKGANITLFVPGGEEIAKRTYNPKLGIVGGISIIGTKGVVEPMSEEAWKEALSLGLKVLRNKGYKSCVFVFGNYGEDFIYNAYKIKKDLTIKVSNFLGYMLDTAVLQEIENILLVGHLGKLIKVAGGIFQTHSRVADARMEILSSYAALEGVTKDTVKRIYESKTTGEASLIINQNNLLNVYKRTAENATKRCTDYTYGKINIGTILFNEDNTLLYIDENAKKLIGELKEYES